MYYRARTICAWLLMVGPPALLVNYMVSPCFYGLVGVYSFYIKEKHRIPADEPFMDTQRRLQRYFMKFDIALDTNDIIHGKELRKNKTLPFKMKGCLRKHDVIAYVPLTLRLPYFGTQTYEWCLVVRPP